MLVQGSDARFAPLLEWRQTLVANQPTYESSLGLFHPVCLVPITFYCLELGRESEPVSTERPECNSRTILLSITLFLCYVLSTEYFRIQLNTACASSLTRRGVAV